MVVIIWKELKVIRNALKGQLVTDAFYYETLNVQEVAQIMSGTNDMDGFSATCITKLGEIACYTVL